MENETPIIHTFNTDIKEELKKKDAGLLDIALANTNHIEPTNPPNYKAFFSVLAIFIVLGIVSVAVWYFYQSRIASDSLSQNNANVLSATSTKANQNNSLLSLMPSSYTSLSPYISFYKKDNDSKYILYKINNYEGLLATLLNSEKQIAIDLSKSFVNINKENSESKSIDYENFRDQNFNNLDLRLASSTTRLKNEKEIATTTYIESISIKNATITEHIKVKGRTITVKKATTTKIINSIPTTTMIKIIEESYTDSALIYGLVNREYLIFANNINDWQQGYHDIIK